MIAIVGRPQGRAALAHELACLLDRPLVHAPDHEADVACSMMEAGDEDAILEGPGLMRLLRQGLRPAHIVLCLSLREPSSWVPRRIAESVNAGPRRTLFHVREDGRLVASWSRTRASEGAQA